MTDADEEAFKRSMRRRPSSLVIGLIAATLIVLLLTALLWPIAKEPPPSQTLPQVFTMDSVESYKTPPTFPQEHLAGWVETFRAHREIPTDAPAGVRAYAAQTAALLYTSSEGFQASGFVFRSGIVVSAAHLLDVGMSGARVYVDCGTGAKPSEVIACDRIRDVLVVAAPQCDGLPMRLNTKRLRKSDTLYKTGFTFHPPRDGARAEQYLIPTSPIPSADRSPTDCRDCTAAYKESVRRAQIPTLRAISGIAIKGHSGSPVFFKNGDLAGMIVQLDGDHPRAYIVGAQTIGKTLEHLGIR